MYILQSFKTHKPLLRSTCSAFLPLYLLFLPNGPEVPGFRASSPPWLRCPLLCSPYTSSGTPAFLFPRLCASFKTKFLGLLWKPLYVPFQGAFHFGNSVVDKGSEVGQGVRMACEMNPWTQCQGLPPEHTVWDRTFSGLYPQLAEMLADGWDGA